MSNVTVGTIALSGVAALGLNWGLNLGLDAAPIVAYMEPRSIEQARGVYEAEIFGRKIQECVPVKGTFAGYQRVGGVWVETPFDFIDDVSPGNARPTGKQSFGRWRWSDISPDATDVQITVTHICDGDEPRLTVIGPFKV